MRIMCLGYIDLCKFQLANVDVCFSLLGLAPGFTYSMMLNRVASHGFVAVGIWKEESPANSFNESWFDKTVAFVENDLETSLHLSGRFLLE